MKVAVAALDESPSGKKKRISEAGEIRYVLFTSSASIALPCIPGYGSRIFAGGLGGGFNLDFPLD